MILADSGIVDVLVKACADYLQEKLVLDVADGGQAGVARSGLLQDDPSVGRINLLVRSDKDRPNGLNVSPQGYDTPTYEFGNGRGAAAWVRNIHVELNIFIDDVDTYDDAHSVAYMTLSRVEYFLAKMPLIGIQDTFGESANFIQVRDSTLVTGGGDNTWIFRGWVKVEFQTTKAYR